MIQFKLVDWIYKNEKNKGNNFALLGIVEVSNNL